MKWAIIASILILIAVPVLLFNWNGVIGPIFGQVENKVLHVEVSMVAISPEGGTTQTKTHDLWFDPNTNDTKYVVKDAAGALQSVSVRQGREAKTYVSKTNSLTTNIAATDDAEMLNVASLLLGYPVAFERGELERLGEGEVRGRKALQVRRQWLSQPVTVTSWIDKETLLPLEETFSEAGAGGKQEVLSTSIWTYKVLERVSRGQIPAGVFALDVPPDATRVTTKYMSAAEAAGFRDFDIYYVGASFNGLPIALFYTEAIGPGYPQQLVRFDVAYSDPFIRGKTRRPDQLSLVQQPARLHQPREIAPGQLAVGESVQINGVEATIYDYTGPGAALELLLGSTFITIHGGDRQQVLQAAGSLQKLN